VQILPFNGAETCKSFVKDCTHELQNSVVVDVEEDTDFIQRNIQNPEFSSICDKAFLQKKSVTRGKFMKIYFPTQCIWYRNTRSQMSRLQRTFEIVTIIGCSAFQILIFRQSQNRTHPVN
jgi:hypothetical protein